MELREKQEEAGRNKVQRTTTHISKNNQTITVGECDKNWVFKYTLNNIIIFTRLLKCSKATRLEVEAETMSEHK